MTEGSGLLPRLLEVAKRPSIPSTYLFQGPEGLGKKRTAFLWSRSLLCLHPGHPDNNPCPSCAIFDKSLPDGNPRHPDVLFLSPGEETHIAIDETRRFISELANAPLTGTRRVGIIDDAHTLTENAANSLLKTLEDPPEKTVLILVTHLPQSLLPTIRSRALSISFSTRSREEMEKILDESGEGSLSREERDMILLLSRGAPGQLRALLDSPQRPNFGRIPRVLTVRQKTAPFDTDLLPFLSEPEGFSCLGDALESLLLDLYRLEACPEARTSMPVPPGLVDSVSHLKREEFHDKVQELRALAIYNINRSMAVEELLWDWNETLASGNDEPSKTA
ncbi:MAG: hypothetical protein ACYCRD_03160 [Leptospirillum sp.]